MGVVVLFAQGFVLTIFDVRYRRDRPHLVQKPRAAADGRRQISWHAFCMPLYTFVEIAN